MDIFINELFYVFVKKSLKIPKG